MKNWCVKDDDVIRATLLRLCDLNPRGNQYLACHGVIERHIAFHREIFHISGELRRPDHTLHNCYRSQAREEINIIVTQATWAEWVREYDGKKY